MIICDCDVYNVQNVKLIRYFKEHGWPSSTVFETPPEDDSDRENLIDTLQVSINVCALQFWHFLVMDILRLVRLLECF